MREIRRLRAGVSPVLRRDEIRDEIEMDILDETICKWSWNIRRLVDDAGKDMTE